MSLSPGTRLGHYAVTSLLGEGGMGQVWQATDTQLNRQVALKILPDAFADDPDRLARFTREAQILASLNHPNIAQIHGIEEAEGTQALVLELVEGPTLADRIAKGPIPLDEALPIARQIAEALEAAHEAGVIHRDLKPANIKVREDGTVKVLDFGLAKALDPNPEGDPSQSPTLTAAATQMGVIMGTAAYMSPEQARGKPVDKRTDIWAFGCVLFEMITGRLAFAGETISDTIAKLLEHKPPWNALPSGTPSAVRRLLHRCLDKAPRDRLHDMADARLEITEAVSTPDAETTEVLAVRPLQVWQRPIPAAVLVVALVALTGLSIWFVAETDSAEVVRFSIAYDESLALFVADSSPDVAMSPDGRHVAYLAGGGMLAADELRVRSLDRMSSFTVAAGGEFRSPFFSPDSGSVGFFARQGSARLLLRRVSVLGGPVVTICEVDTPLRGASWGMDGTIIFGSSDTSTGLWRVSDAGGEPELLTTPDSEQDEVDHYWPHILPGGGAVLFTVVGNVQDFQIEDARIAVLSLETNEWKVLLRGGAFPQYSPSGHLVYVAAGRLWAVGFDLRALETVGESVPVLEGVPTKRHGSANVGLSQSGAMVYMPTGGSMGEQRTLVWIDQEGREETLDVDTAPYESPRVSPDGRYVALEVRNPQNTDVVVYDRERRTQTRLTSDPAFDGHPLWSPDGRRVFFSSDRGGAQDVFSRSLDAISPIEQVTRTPSNQWAHSWSADGQTIVGVDFTPEWLDIVLIPVGSGDDLVRRLETPFLEVYPEVSPDGQWIAYGSNEAGQFQVVVRPFPNLSDGKWTISRDGGVSPVWARDGDQLFFRTADGTNMMVVDVDTETTFDFSSPEVLFSTPYLTMRPGRTRPWDVAPDGRFLMIRDFEQSEPESLVPHLVIILNWATELERLLSAD